MVLPLAFSTFACEDPPKEKPAETASTTAAAQPEPPPAPPKPSAPTLFIDEQGPRAGMEAANLEEPGGRQRLSEMVANVRGFLSAGDVRLNVDRKAKPEWVAAYLTELGKQQVSQVSVRTPSRPEYPLEVIFAPEERAKDAPACTVVAMITEDRGTAVWKKGGGAAGKRPKGMAGPDLSMTQDSIARLAKACNGGGVLIVSGAKGVEWGLVYDLAASAKMIPGTRFDLVVAPSRTPTPGHKVELGQ